MSLTLSAPYWFTRPWYPEGGQERVCDIHGLPDTQGRTEAAQVDATIAPIIAMLNELGWATSFCCSGVEEDHRDSPEAAREEFPPWQRAYILFADSTEGLAPLIPATRYWADDGSLCSRGFVLDTRSEGWHRLGGLSNQSNADLVKAWGELEKNLRLVLDKRREPA